MFGRQRRIKTLVIQFVSPKGSEEVIRPLTASAFIRYSRDMASEGDGIGLSLVKRICDRYGWQVRLESRDHG